MSGHHGHHRSSHHSRSRMHHSSSSHYSSVQRLRTGSSTTVNDSNLGSSNHRNNHQSHDRGNSSASCDWQEHKSSSGKVYYYNPRTGVSQWEVPAELRQQQTKSHHPPQQQSNQQQQQQQQRLASPQSEVSESSSIRQGQQENSPSSSTSSQHSAQSDSVIEDKPLLTPSLINYFKPDLIVEFNSGQREELEKLVHQLDHEILLLNEKLLEERVEIKISKSRLEHAVTQVEAQETKCVELRKTIERFGAPNYQ